MDFDQTGTYILLNEWMDFDHTCTSILLGHGKKLTFCFSADPVGVGIGIGIGIASCLHSISLMNGWILVKLTQIYHWVGEKY